MGTLKAFEWISQIVCRVSESLSEGIPYGFENESKLLFQRISMMVLPTRREIKRDPKAFLQGSGIEFIGSLQ